MVTVQFTIPSTHSLEGQLNTIFGPTLVVVMQNVDFGHRTKLNSFTVGGAQIWGARRICLYVWQGEQLYAYQDMCPQHPGHDCAWDWVGNPQAAIDAWGPLGHGYKPDMTRIGGLRPQ
jgi:hypothetical protein